MPKRKKTGGDVKQRCGAKDTTEPSGADAEAQTTGCNCPAGCVVGTPIPAGMRPAPKGAVRVVCSNGRCPAVPLIHAQCYEKWEEKLVRVLGASKGRARDWDADWTLKVLWTKHCTDLTFRSCKCACGGVLARDVDADARLPKPAAVRLCLEWRRVALDAYELSGAAKEGKRQAAMPCRCKYGGTDEAVYNCRSKCVREALGECTYDWSPQRYDNTAPVGVAGWRRAVGYADDEAAAPRVHQSSLDDYMSAAWPSLQPLSACAAAAATSADDEGLSAAQFVSELEAVVRLWRGEVWAEHAVVADLQAKLSGQVMADVCDAGGFDRWLPLNSDRLVVHRGRVVLREAMATARMHSVGVVHEILDEKGSEGVVLCDSYQCRVHFGRGTDFVDGNHNLFPDDIVSFEAEASESVLPGGCKWLATSTTLLQRATDVASSSADVSVAESPNASFDPLPFDRSVGDSPLPQFPFTFNEPVEVDSQPFSRLASAAPFTHNSVGCEALPALSNADGASFYAPSSDGQVERRSSTRASSVSVVAGTAPAEVGESDAHSLADMKKGLEAHLDVTAVGVGSAYGQATSELVALFGMLDLTPSGAAN